MLKKITELIDDEYVEVERYFPEPEIDEEQSTPNEALNNFMVSLASTDTNSIAKIRAVAQKFIDSTSEVSD
jgi:hypothetical protein